MSRIKQILGWKNAGEYALVYALTDQGDEVTAIVGGEVEVYLHKGTIRAFVKKTVDKED